jgi:hypothetical protein
MPLAANASGRRQLVVCAPRKEPGLHVLMLDVMLGLDLPVCLTQLRQHLFLVGNIAHASHPRGLRSAPAFLRRLAVGECRALLASPPVRRTARAVSRTPRRAWFTACSLGKASATSGSNTTILVRSRSRFRYLARTPPFIAAKSYSGRISPFAFRSVFFIEL